jgi:hypothetical protein
MPRSPLHDCDYRDPLTVPLQKTKILIVEGKDECNFFQGIFNHLGFTDDVQIYVAYGETLIKSKIRAIQNASEFPFVKSIGFVRDSDDDPIGKFTSTKNALRELGLPTPDSPYTVVGDSLKCAIMMMPDSGELGALEDLCLKAIRECPELSCVDNYFRCLNDFGCDNARKKSKATISVFLASKPDHCSIGVAAKKTYWDFNHSSFDKVKTCLTGLFGA